MKTQKAGCFLIDLKTKSVALIFRKNQNDYSFPKGHIEIGENLEECAVRETEEETKRTPKIIKSIKPIIDKYKTPSGENCECYMYFAIDCGSSDNKSVDTHELMFVPLMNVKDRLTYDGLKKVWDLAMPQIELIIKTFSVNLNYLNKIVNVKMDRLMGSCHPKHGFIYPVNYGYLPNTISGDGEELDAYVLGEHKPLGNFTGRVVAIIHRLNDDDDKLIVMQKDSNYTDDQIRALTEFQEKYFESIIIR